MQARLRTPALILLLLLLLFLRVTGRHWRAYDPTQDITEKGMIDSKVLERQGKKKLICAKTWHVGTQEPVPFYAGKMLL